MITPFDKFFRKVVASKKKVRPVSSWTPRKKQRYLGLKRLGRVVKRGIYTFAKKAQTKLYDNVKKEWKYAKDKVLRNPNLYARIASYV